MNSKQVLDEIRFCPFCGGSIQSQELQNNCQSCGRKPSSVLFEPKSYTYTSRWTLFGWPLIHIAFGPDSKTKKLRWAKGVIAIGDRAIGGFAFGGLAMGGIAFGGGAIGMVSIGGGSLGLLAALGGGSISLGLAIGGFAMGSLAIGGTAIGLGAFGGAGFGQFVASGSRRDIGSMEMLNAWQVHSNAMAAYLTPIITFCVIAPLLFFPFLRKSPLKKTDEGEPKEQVEIDEGSPTEASNISQFNTGPTKNTVQETSTPRASAAGMCAIILTGGVTGVMLIWIILLITSLIVA